MALPVFNEAFAEVLSLPKKEQLARWFIAVAGSGIVSEYATFPDHYLYAKIAVAYGCARSEADYISLPIVYILNDIYKALTDSTQEGLIFDDIRSGMGFVLSAIRGDTSSSELLGYYINLPEKYQLALAAISLINAVIVTGAGTNESNGTYQYLGMYNGRPSYSGLSNDANYIRLDGEMWVLFDENLGSISYASDDNLAYYPWLAAWYQLNGDYPYPTLTPSNI